MCPSWNIAPPLHTLLNFWCSCSGVTVWLRKRSCRRWAAKKSVQQDEWCQFSPTTTHTEWGGNFRSVSIRQQHKTFFRDVLVLRPIVPSRFVGTRYLRLHIFTCSSDLKVLMQKPCFMWNSHLHTHSLTLDHSHWMSLSPYLCLPSPRTDRGASCAKSSFSTNRSGSEGLCPSSSSRVVWHSAALSAHDSLIDGTCSAD